MYVLHLAGAGVAFVIQYHVVGAHHLFFSTELVGHAGFELGTGGVVAQLQTTQTLFLVKIDTHHFVHFLVEGILVDDGTLEDDVWRLSMLLGKGDEITPHPRVYQRIQPLQHRIVGKDNGGNGLLVDTPVRAEDLVAKESPHLLLESGVAVVVARHLVGNKRGDAQQAELLEHGGLAAPYATRQRHKERPAGGITVS